ncbi:MAG: hypothetical protein ABR502_08080 [Chitinophagaceae bacterium]
MKPAIINSLKDLQQKMPRIIQEHGNNQSLTTLALVNPIYALEKIGYSFAKEAREEIELYVRFGKENTTYVKELKAVVFKYTGKKFNLDEPSELKKHIAPILSRSQNEPGDATQKKYKSDDAIPSGLLHALSEKVIVEMGEVRDPLTAYKNIHPAIDALVEYRKLNATNAPLADAATAEKIVKHRERLPLKNIRFRMNRKKSQLQ